MKRNIGVAHFGIAVSDLRRSIEFYCNVVGCTLIRADSKYAFLDAGGACVNLCLQTAPIRHPGDLDFLHHAFMVSEEDFREIVDHLTAHGLAIDEEREDNRPGRVISGPRVYFRDPDGSRLELIYRTSYNPEPKPNA